MAEGDFSRFSKTSTALLKEVVFVDRDIHISIKTWYIIALSLVENKDVSLS